MEHWKAWGSCRSPPPSASPLPHPSPLPSRLPRTPPHGAGGCSADPQPRGAAGPRRRLSPAQTLRPGGGPSRGRGSSGTRPRRQPANRERPQTRSGRVGARPLPGSVPLVTEPLGARRAPCPVAVLETRLPFSFPRTRLAVTHSSGTSPVVSPSASQGRGAAGQGPGGGKPRGYGSAGGSAGGRKGLEVTLGGNLISWEFTGWL